MKSIVEVNPFECRMWLFHDRMEGNVNDESCRAEIESFSKHGQLVPVLGRLLRGDPDHKVELIFGARRLFVARHLNRPLLAEIRELSDREAFVAMDIENRQRRDISPYERGMSYARWLRSGNFKSQEDIANSLKISASQVSRLLKLAHLPAVIVNAFESPVQIFESWGLDLAAILEDPSRKAQTIKKAREIAEFSPRPSGQEVYRRLLSASTPGRKIKVESHDQVIRNKLGHPLFRIRQQRNSIAILLPHERISATSLQEIQSAIGWILGKDIEGRAEAISVLMA